MGTVDQMRSGVSLAIRVVLWWFSVWTGWQYVDAARYSLQGAHLPVQLGEVTTLTPSDIGHNTYVCVDGISEHRGLRHEISRALGASAQPYWTFRLLGSRGIFVEVPPEPQQFSTTQAMHVCGRALDPERTRAYRSLVATYAQLFHVELSGPTRIVQHGLEPGAFAKRYVLAMAAWVTLVLAQLAAAVHQAWRLIARRRHAEGRA